MSYAPTANKKENIPGGGQVGKVATDGFSNDTRVWRFGLHTIPHMIKVEKHRESCAHDVCGLFFYCYERYHHELKICDGRAWIVTSDITMGWKYEIAIGV